MKRFVSGGPVSETAAFCRARLGLWRRRLSELRHAVLYRRRTEQALAAVARGVSVATGQGFFQSLVDQLAKALGADCAYVGRLLPGSLRVRMIAVCSDGAPAPLFEYDLRGSPCERVMERRLCSYRQGVRQLFPEDQVLAQLGIEGYVGTVLADTAGRPLGIMGVLTRQPLADTAVVESVLRIFAVRAAAELEREQAVESLRINEAHFRELAERTSDWVWEVDAPGRYTYCSPKIKELLGYEVHEVVGRTPFDLMPPEEAERVRAIYDAHAASGRALVVLENVNLHKDGRRVVLETSGVPRYDAAGRLAGYRGIDRDITARKRAEEQLRQAKEEAERANAAKDQFLATLSHELRTPLTPVLAAAEMLAGDARLPGEVVDDLKMIARNAELEARLIDDLLDVTRIIRGKLELRRQVVDARPLIEHVIGISRASEAAGKGQRIVIDLGAADHRVRADPTRLQQMLWNLLNNALKFTPASGTVTIRTTNSAEPRVLGTQPPGHEDTQRQMAGGQQRPVPGTPPVALIVEVSDTGIGIAPASLDRIFRAFEQESPATTQAFGGLGLGLAISRALAEMHGGTLTAYSEGVGRGATFTLALPLLAAEPQREPEPAPVATAGAAAPSGASARAAAVRLLLVEDHVDTVRLLSRVLRQWGYQVETATSLEGARALAAGQPFDVLISDLGLPDGSGLELMSDLRRTRPGLRGIALSGYGREQDRARSLEAGFAEHLTKPVSLAELESAIHRVLRGSGS